MDLTFILPARNRRQWVRRAADSCLQNERPSLKIQILVLDGHSTDGTWEELLAAYATDRRVRLLRQGTNAGFMGACFQAVPLVKTSWATFMYDDDVLSPHWHLLAGLVDSARMSFGMGLGVKSHVGKLVNFSAPDKWLRISSSDLLRGYGDAAKWWRPDWLPVSPICCLTQTAVLQEWFTAVNTFSSKNMFRQEYLIRRAAGPDLMIYLLSLLRSQGPVAVLRAPIAQFSEHDETISSSSGEDELALGYWLARAWLAHQLQREKRPEAPAWAGWVCHRALLLLRDRWRSGRFQPSLAILREFISLRCLFQGQDLAAWRSYFLSRFVPKALRPKVQVDTEAFPLA